MSAARLSIALCLTLASFAADAATYRFYHLGINGVHSGDSMPVLLSPIPLPGTNMNVAGYDDSGGTFLWYDGTLSFGYYGGPSAVTALSQNGYYGFNAYTSLPSPSPHCFLGTSWPALQPAVGPRAICMLNGVTTHNGLGVATGATILAPSGFQRAIEVDCTSATVCTSMTQLPTLGGNESAGLAIKYDLTQVGWSNNASGATRAFYFSPGQVSRDMDPSHPQYNSVATAINAYSQVVGWIAPGPCPPPPYVLCSGQNSHYIPVSFDINAKFGAVPQSLGTLGGSDGQALAINGAGTVVGWSTTRGGLQRAFIYTNGTMSNLNSASIVNADGTTWTGWTLIEADGINDRGQIVGRAQGPSGVEIFALTP